MSKVIDTMIETARTIWEATLTVINPIPAGERTTVKDIAEQVGAATSQEARKVLPFVDHFVHNAEGVCYVSRGKFGGVIRGSKADKPSKPVISTVVDETEEASDE
jgi:hypothetical protein